MCTFYLTFLASPQGAQAGLSGVVWTPPGGERGWLAASADGERRNEGKVQGEGGAGPGRIF